MMITVNFILPPLLSSAFVQECQSCLGWIFDKGGLEKPAFLPDKGKPGMCLSSISNIKVGHYGLMCFSFVNMVFFACQLLLTLT